MGPAHPFWRPISQPLPVLVQSWSRSHRPAIDSIGATFLFFVRQLTRYGVDRDEYPWDRRQKDRLTLRVRFDMAPVKTTQEPATETPSGA